MPFANGPRGTHTLTRKLTVPTRLVVHGLSRWNPGRSSPLKAPHLSVIPTSDWGMVKQQAIVARFLENESHDKPHNESTKNCRDDPCAHANGASHHALDYPFGFRIRLFIRTNNIGTMILGR